jgi:TonB family protein
VNRLPPENYSIRIEKPGFQTISQQSRVESQKITTVAVKLQRQAAPVSAANVEIQGSPEGAEVRVDGVLIGATSALAALTQQLAPGQHTITVSKENFITQEMKQVFAAGSTTSLHFPLKPNDDAMRWAALQANGTVADLEGYVAQNPTGPHAMQARRLIEDKEWDAVKGSDDLAALTAFSNKHPNGAHTLEAAQLVRALQNEHAIWANAHNSKDLEKLRDYLKTYPDGHFRKAAQDELDLLEKASQQSPLPEIACKKDLSSGIKPPIQAGSVVPCRWLDQPLHWQGRYVRPELKGANSVDGKPPTVMLSFTVDENGRVIDVKPRGNSSLFGMDSALKAAASQWQTNPPAYEGRPVKATFPLDIKIDQQ